MQQPSPTSGDTILRPAEEITSYYWVLSDPLRYRVLKMLCEKAMNVQEITDDLNRQGEKLTRQAVTNALGVLKDYDFVNYEREGKTHTYKVDQRVIDEIVRITRLALRVKAS